MPLNADTLSIIQDTAQQAQGAEGKVKFCKLATEPDYVYAAVLPDGTWTRHEAAYGPRRHTLATLVETIAYANVKGTEENSVVWFSEAGLTVILDDGNRRDKATCDLDYSQPFTLLMKIEAQGLTYTQTEFRRLLKVDLHDCTPNDVLLDWVAGVDFSSQSRTSGTIAKDRSSFGKDIETAVVSKAGSEPPDEIALTMTVFTDPGLTERRRILCAVEVHTNSQKFEIVPYPGEIKRAIDAELANIESRMTGEGGCACPVFRGEP